MPTTTARIQFWRGQRNESNPNISLASTFKMDYSLAIIFLPH